MKEIGRGSFGVASLGEWHGATIVVKQPLHTVTDKVLNDFVREAEIMGSLPAHPHVLGCLGVSVEPPNVCILSNYAVHSDVFRVLVKEGKFNRAVPEDLVSVLQMAVDASSGMDSLVLYVQL